MLVLLALLLHAHPNAVHCAEGWYCTCAGMNAHTFLSVLAVTIKQGQSTSSQMQLQHQNAKNSQHRDLLHQCEQQCS